MRLTFSKLSAFTAVLLFFSFSAKSQGFSFNCARDTILPGCPPNLCFTLKTLIPDPHRQSNNYAVNTSGQAPTCLLASNNPGIPGAPTTLSIDDLYSPAFPIGFPFIFFGTPYNDLVVSSNGYLSFDITEAGQPSHWNIINGGTPQNLPSTFYDKALIMGPYHDIDIGITTSPNRLISYQTSGLAPYRKWILNYYKIPLFSGACNSLIENTHQIILYESTGIIDVNIFDKQICLGWNQGRAMVGVQNFSQTAGVMAPGRAATDAPWGAVGMNESWRFVPIGGTPLFRRVELYNMSNVLIATGTTTVLPNGDRDVSFPNICPPAGASTPYIIKAFYDKIDDPTQEIYAVDTVVVNRQQGLAAFPAAVSATCGNNNGTITVNNTSGGNGTYEYSLDGITWQSSNVFTGVAGGTHTVYVRDVAGSCTANYPVTVGVISNLTATTTNTAAACTGVNNGTITVTSSMGTAPFSFSLDGGAYQAGTIPYAITNLAPGNHTVVVRDGNNCTTNTITVTIATGTGVTATSTATQATCAGVNNGTITVTPTAGAAPFQYSIDGGLTWQASNVFTGLAPATYTIRVRDNVGCTRNITRTVTAGTSLNTNFTIVATTCSGANNGSVTITPVNGTAPYTFVLNGTTTQTGATTVFNNLAPGTHTITVTDANGCVRNPALSVTVLAGPALLTSATHTDALCNGSATGTITVAQPTAGTAPYEYSLDGTTWQTANTFNGLVAGIYTVYYREANGCQGQLSQTVTEPTALAATTATSSAICNGQSNGRIIVSSSGGVGPYEYSIDNGATWQTSNSFNMPAGSYTVIIRDANQCTTTQQVTITEPAALAATIATTNATCNGGNNGTIVITATGGNTSYEYSIDGGSSFLSTNSFNVAPGTYTINVRDNLGCTTTVPNIVVGLTNDLTFAPPANPTICEGTSTQLSITSNALQYAWSPATALSSTSVFNPTANPTTTTNYTVTLTYGRCTADVPVTVNVNAAPIPYAGADGFICYGQTYTLQGTGGTQFNWTPSTYLGAGLNTANPVSTPDKTITYILSVVDANGCRSLVTDSMVLDVTPPIYVNTFPFDTIVYNTDQFPILATSGATDYLWTPTIGLSDPTIANPTVTAGDIGDVIVYKVTASTQAGCKGEGFVRVQVYKGPDLYVPTGFTPNNDGKNDTFFPFPVGIREIKYFRVFNRWGNMVFSTTRLNNGWDGTFSGKEQPSGVYVWMVEGVTKDDRPITKKGTIMLIR